MSTDFAASVRTALLAATEHAARLRDLPEEDHRQLCDSLAATVTAVFEAAEDASGGVLRFHQKRDANGVAVIYGLSVQRDIFTKTCLFIRVDATHLRTWWQLHEGGNLEHALGGWWNLPILDTDEQRGFLEAMVLNLIRCIQETPGSYSSRF